MLFFLLLAVALPCCAQVGPVRVLITPANKAIAAGASQQLTAHFSFLGNRGGGADVSNQVVWQSSNAGIATVTNTGMVSASSSNRGTVTITAIRGPFRGSTTLTVIPAAALTSLTVAPKTPSIPKGLKQQFTATGGFTGGINQDVTASAAWSSADGTVAIINAPGLVKGVNQGSVTITAAFQGFNDSATLTVIAPILQSIVVAPSNPTIPAGLNQQFSAIGVLSDNSTQDLTSVATWASTNTAVATIATGGLAASHTQGSSTISATYLGITGSTLLTVGPPLLLSIAVTPVNPTIPQGSTLQLTATGSYTDLSKKNLTNLVAWTSSKPAVVPVNNAGLISGNAVGFSTISATQGGMTGSTGALIGFSALSLNGRYAFSFTGVDSNGEFLGAGSFQADGRGHLLNGAEDFNGGTGVTQDRSFSGSYTVGIDGRGSASLTTGDTLKFVLTALGNALIIEFDNLAVASGTAEPQNPAAFVNLQGNFAFQLSGLSKTGAIADVGQFTADGAGNILNGREDVNDTGATSSFTFTGNYAAVDSTGRGTVTLHNNDGTTSRFSYYIVAADQVNLISLDFVPAFLGVANLRSGQTFSNGSVSGFYVFSETGPVSTDQFKTNVTLFNAAGVFFADGAGNFSGRQDSNNGGSVHENSGTSGTYNVASNGRGTATIDGFPYVLYVVSPSLAYFMNTDSGAVLTRTIESQPAITFGTSSFQGNFGLLLSGEDLINTTSLAMSAQMFADGSGGLSGIEDINNNGVLSPNVALNGTYSVETDGRGSGSINGPHGTLTLHFYMISFDKAFFVETDANNDQIGSALVQF
jgi:Bacterial Ig-like domain (group 2)